MPAEGAIGLGIEHPYSTQRLLRRDGVVLIIDPVLSLARSSLGSSSSTSSSSPSRSAHMASAAARSSSETASPSSSERRGSEAST